MHYAGIKNFDSANGPGFRVTLFVSGCRHQCPGCFNQEAWDFRYGKEFTIQTLLEIDNMLDDDNVNGLSILGGDPFELENRAMVEAICEYVKWNHIGKDVWVWTGYYFEDLRDLPIMNYIDILVDGPFEQDKKDLRLAWRGSSNQRVIDVQKSLASGEVVLYCD